MIDLKGFRQFLIIGLLTGAFDVVAAEPVSIPTSLPLEDCGVACRYRKANDNLTLQVLYSMNKLKAVQEAHKNNNESDVFKALDGFCTTDEVSNQKSGECVTRYEKFQGMALLRLRQAMGANEDVIARLTSRRLEDGTFSQDGDMVYTPDVAETAYTPDVPTLKDLENEFKKSGIVKTPKSYTKSEMKKWSEQLVLQKPTKDFVEFKKETVVANPKSPNSGKLAIVNRDQNRNELVDKRVEKKYREFEKDYKESLDSANTVTGDVLIKDHKASSPEDLKRMGDQISIDAFRDARNTIIEKVESKPDTDVRSVGTQSKVFNDDYRIQKPKESTNSRYIRYDLETLFKDIEDMT